SLVGLIPLFAVSTLEQHVLHQFSSFVERLEWYLRNRPQILSYFTQVETPDGDRRGLLSLVSPERLRRLLAPMLDEDQFLSPHGSRALPRCYEQPYEVQVGDHPLSIRYEPGESQTGVFGGNSNWRGPVWFPVNFLIIEALQQFHYFLGDDFQVPFPTGSD